MLLPERVNPRLASSRPLASRYPSWPLVALFGFTPLWWALGLLDVILIPLAVVMVMYLVRGGGVRVPRGFALWLLFLVWMLCSIVMVDTPNHMVAFLYRAAIYVGSTVVFIYIYNDRGPSIGRRVTGMLTVHWLWVVGGGFLGIVLPSQIVKTPAFYLLREVSVGLATNDFINHMVVRRFAQYNPESYLGVAARPSAPFLYANNWGNAFSLLLPVVIVYMLTLRRSGTQRDRLVFWVLAAVVALSVIPASFTLNRGMLIGLGVAAFYLAIRLAARGNILAMAVIVLLAVAGALVFQHLAGARLETRLEGSGTSTRASLYRQSLEIVPESPIFGYGVPPTSQDPDAPPVGTQGQFWMILVSNGPVAILAFMGFFLIAWVRSWRRWDSIGLMASTMCLVSVVELGFYGVVPYGMPIMMTLAALTFRRPDEPPVRPARDQEATVWPRPQPIDLVPAGGLR